MAKTATKSTVKMVAKSAMKTVVYSYSLTAITVIDNSTVIDTALNMALNETTAKSVAK
jgi:hypothetical protein